MFTLRTVRAHFVGKKIDSTVLRGVFPCTKSMCIKSMQLKSDKEFLRVL